MPTRHYTNLGPVKPWVQRAADDIGGQFNITTVYGYSYRYIEGTHTLSDHALGLALDFMVYGDKAKGDELANWVKANAKDFNVTYIMWYQHIWDIARDAEGWRLFADRGSITANHMDHVHVSFQPTDSGGGAFAPKPEPGWESKLADPLGIGGLKAILDWLGNGHNWYRILLVLSGAALLIFALMHMNGGAPSGTPVGYSVAAGKAIRKL